MHRITILSDLAIEQHAERARKELEHLAIEYHLAVWWRYKTAIKETFRERRKQRVPN